MAGTFTHLIVVDSICQASDILDSINTLTKKMKYALKLFNNFCEFGAVSPDAPYLNLLNKDAGRWADVMHYWKPADLIRHAIPYVYNMDFRNINTQKCFAWLFGYTAHVVTDFTVHPVINLRVGAYEQNKLQHRICELNQDVYIFHEQGYGNLNTVEFIKNCGIESCADEAYDDMLDPIIRNLWEFCLNSFQKESIKIKNGLITPKADPAPDKWFDSYVTMIDKFAEEGGKFPRLIRDFVEAEGLVYPQLNEIDQTFIHNLKMPDGTLSDYSEVFNQTKKNIIKTWSELGSALDSGDYNLFTLPNGDLDTGLDENNKSIFWR